MDQKIEQQKLTPSLIILLIVGSVFFTFTVLYIEEYISKKSQEKALEEVSKAYSTSIQSFRNFYSTVILEKLHGTNIEITHDYANKENAVPIPATMTLDLISYLNNNNAKANLSLVSEYPFKWRKNRVLSEFDKEALTYFQSTSKDHYSKMNIEDNHSVYKYAIPIRMQASCVACHNSHPKSSKIDWKVGDIRGVQVINLEPEVIAVKSIEDRIYFVIAILLFFTFNISIIIWLLQRNNFAFALLMKDKSKLADALDSANKANEAKDQFLANISHEVRTPLNAIIGFADIMCDSKLPKTEHEQAKIISTSAKSLLSIINDILDFSKMESGKFEIKPEAESLSDVSQHIYNLFNVKASEKDILLQYEYDTSIPGYLNFDALRLQQVISNLLGNAIKFTSQCGVIDYKVNLLGIKDQKAQVEFVIKDSGIGIPKEKQEHIFKPFSQVDESVSKNFGGTGLGLTIITKILHMMGSEIKLESELNVGSTFCFVLDLPLCDNKEKANQKDQSSEELMLSGKVLVAEDNPINQKLLQAMFTKYSLQIDYADDGNKAFELYQKSQYDLILMDINMPNCDGIQATKLIRDYEQENALNQTPIVALTANAIKGDREKYMAQGMDNYIDKPINVDKLKNILYDYLSTSSNVEIEYSLEEAKKNLELDDESIRLLVENFLDSIDDDLEKLKQSIESNNTQNIYVSAHYIKSATINYCMHDATKELEKIEIKAQCGETVGYKLEPLNNIFKTIKEQFKQGV